MNFKKIEKTIDFSKFTEYNRRQKKNVCSLLKGDVEWSRGKTAGPALEEEADGFRANPPGEGEDGSEALQKLLLQAGAVRLP